MLEGDIKRWTFQDLEGLVGRAQESRTLEFKRELPPKDGGARSFAKGIAAFANTNGGDFLIGIEAIRGVVTAISGIPAEDPDAYIRQLSDVLATQVEPPLPPVDIRAIRCPTGCWVFVARIPKSWAGPHRTVFDRHFYVRNSAASLPLDVAGLRVAFRGHEDVVERVDGFRRERLTRLIGRTAPVRLKPGPILAVHLAPLPRFVDRNSIDIVQLVTSGTEMPMPLNVPPRSGYPRANLLGFIHFEDDGARAPPGMDSSFVRVPTKASPSRRAMRADGGLMLGRLEK